MKVAGFSFIRNAVQLDYPVVEAIKSVLPLCDAFYIALGNSSDSTNELIKSIPSDKIRVFHTVWDENLRTGGRVLAAETDKAFQAIPEDFDWAFYIQGDEIVHENDWDKIHAGMTKYYTQKNVEGLLFKYKHFYGSYDFVAQSYQWYRHEIRIIRNIKDIFSYRDAQGFRKKPNEKLLVKPLDAYIYHYGHVRNPNSMLKKNREFVNLWDNQHISIEDIDESQLYDYMQWVQQLGKYTETHPAVMSERIARLNWNFEYDLKKNHFTFKDKLRLFCEKNFGWIPGEYRNYKILK
jgi:hypothetical protein